MPIGDILRNHVKEKLKRDEVVASRAVRLVRSTEIARIAATAGFDTLHVDVEHSSFSLEAASQICMAALAAGITPFVRVPASTPDYVSRALDGGALGVIVPHIGSAAEACSGEGGEVPAARRALECRRPTADMDQRPALIASDAHDPERSQCRGRHTGFRT